MDHFDRLMQRALALPRAAGPALFDPFDQVAPAGQMDAPAPFIPAAPPMHQRTAAQSDLAPAPAHAFSPGPPLPDARAPIGTTSVLPPLADVPSLANTAPEPITPTTSQPKIAPLRSEAHEPGPPNAWERADQFMRELGVPNVPRAPQHAISPSADAVSPRTPPQESRPLHSDASAALRHAPADTAATAHRPKLEPAAPAPRSEPASRPPSASARSEPVAEATTPEPKARPSPPANAAPTTLVQVQAANRSGWVSDLERLGSSTPMARFGVGQW